MPLAAYLRNVGAALLALLLIADFYLSTPPIVQKAAAYPPVLRIHSDQKWPERINFDTTQVVVAAVAPSPWDVDAPAPPAANKIPTKRVDASGVRDALALLPRLSVQQKKRQLKFAVRSTRTHAKSQILLPARQGQLAWFGFRTW
jgi:hypothetical protein